MLLLRAGARGADYRCNGGGRYAGRTVYALWRRGLDAKRRGSNRLRRAGGLAGSTLSLDAAVRNMVEYAGVTAEDAIHMASLHPARLLGVDGQLGSLAPGKRANIIALDGGLHLQQIWIQGQALSL